METFNTLVAIFETDVKSQLNAWLLHFNYICVDQEFAFFLKII